MRDENKQYIVTAYFNGTNSFSCFLGLLGREYMVWKHGNRAAKLAPQTRANRNLRRTRSKGRMTTYQTRVRGAGDSGCRACESSRQGATATPTAVLLSSIKRPSSTARDHRPCLLPKIPMGIRGPAPAIRGSTEVARVFEMISPSNPFIRSPESPQ